MSRNPSARMNGMDQETVPAPVSLAPDRLPVLKDWFLIIRPDETWNHIVADRRGAGLVFLCYLLPMMLLVALVEGHGLMLIGRHESAAGLTDPFPFARVFGFEVTQGLLLLLSLLVGAIFIKSFGNACHRRNHLSQSLLVLFHAAGPLLLVQLLNGIPNLGVYWASWLIGIALTVSTLYYGLPRIMRPDPPSAMGLFLAGGFVVFLLLLGGRLFTYFYLTGDLHLHGTALSGFIVKWSH